MKYLSLVMAATLFPGTAMAQKPPAAPATTPSAPDASEPAVTLIQSHCTACHDSAQVMAAKKTPAEWSTTIDTMIGYGAELDSADRGVIERYLTAHNVP